MEGVLVDRAAVLRDWTSVIVAVRNHLFYIPMKLAQRVLLCKTPQDVQDLIRDEIELACDEFNKAKFTFLADDSDDDTDDSDSEGEREPRKRGARASKKAA